MSGITWKNNLVIRLVEEYKNLPVLWDSTNDMYRIMSAKHLAWSTLAETFECDIADLKKKLNSVLASHRREKAKVRAGGYSSWFLYPYMNFLPSYVENNSLEETIQESNNKSQDDSEQWLEEDSQDEEDSYNDEITIKEEPVIEKVDIPEKKISPKPSMSSKPRLVKRLKRRVIKEASSSHIDSRLLDMRILRRPDLIRKKDECDSFGEYIADSLRKHDEKTQSMIKQAINNILFEQEMKKYNTGQYVVISGIVDNNPLI